MKKVMGVIAVIAAIVFAVYLFTPESVDDLLDEYEGLVNELAEYARETRNADSSNDTAGYFAKLAAIQKKMMKFQKDAENIGGRLSALEDDMTEEQTARFYRISFSMMGMLE